jgi:hypothetical protein
MLDAIKPLLDSGLINEDISKTLNEAWETKLNEAKEQVRAELREEYAQKYEHDRSVMVEALDKMVTESLSEEIRDFNEEKKAMSEDRVKGQMLIQEQATKFNNFMVTKLAEEIRELRNDRKVQLENQQKLEKFVVHALAREIKEFAADKQAVVEARVKLVAEGRKQLEALKAKFVAESANKVGTAVAKHLKTELSQLKEDIKVARENNFGRKLFEAYASEYSVTYLNDKAETRKIKAELEAKAKALAEATAKAEEAKKLVESKDREVRIIKESTQREQVLGDLLAPLNKEKAAVMKTLLESVQTTKLKAAFDKYLPSVLNTGSEKVGAKTTLTESVVKEVTGDKETTAKKEVEVDPIVENNLIDFKRLAGL